MSAQPFFAFEADFVESLRCIPMRVRYKLDTCGIKLKLVHWNAFSPAERQSLVDLPCDRTEDIATYTQHLQTLVVQHTGTPAGNLPVDPHPPWLNPATVPDQVQAEAAKHGLTLELTDWQHLKPDQRFALLKLSQPSHENRNFMPALREFGLAEGH